MQDFPLEHKDFLEKRLDRIEKGETKFKNWDLIKKRDMKTKPYRLVLSDEAEADF